MFRNSINKSEKSHEKEESKNSYEVSVSQETNTFAVTIKCNYIVSGCDEKSTQPGVTINLKKSGLVGAENVTLSIEPNCRKSDDEFQQMSLYFRSQIGKYANSNLSSEALEKIINSYKKFLLDMELIDNTLMKPAKVNNSLTHYKSFAY